MMCFPKSDFLRLLLRLHRDEATGVISLKDGGRQFFLYLKGGDAVYAEGDNKETLLVKEIASRKKLDQEAFTELTLLSEEQPRQLGKTLIDRGLISRSGWRRFLEEKIKAVVSEALALDAPDIAFSQSELGILPINFAYLPMAALVFERTLELKNLPQICDYLKAKEPVFRINRRMLCMKDDLPFTFSQGRLLSLLEAEKNSSSLLNETGLGLDALAADLYVLASIGLIEEASPGAAAELDPGEYADTIHLYRHLLLTVKTALGDKAFRAVLEKWATEEAGPVKTIFHGLPLMEDDLDALTKEILRRFSTLGTLADKRLLLRTSFNKLIYLMLSRVRKTAGQNRAKNLLDQMTKILIEAEEGKRHPDLMLYLLGNLEDYEKQMA